MGIGESVRDCDIVMLVRVCDMVMPEKKDFSVPDQELFLRVEGKSRRRFESAEDISLKVEVGSEVEVEGVVVWAGASRVSETSR